MKIFLPIINIVGSMGVVFNYEFVVIIYFDLIYIFYFLKLCYIIYICTVCTNKLLPIML